ncbi:MAG TPA: alpha/beta hydrolase [Actinomycetota bacterium]|jgi:pimeloyl-ACP methyl ester carboxylesterase
MLVRRIELNADGPARPAWEVSPESSPRGGAAVFHGYGSCKENMLGLALALAEAGLVCTVPDLPGHGEHPGPFGPSLLEEVRSTIEHVRRHGAALAVGHSMGGRLALLSGADAVVAISPALPMQPSPEGMYALRTFSTPKVRQARPGQVVEVLGDLPIRPAFAVPVLVVLGDGDIPGIGRAAEELVSSLDGADLVTVTEGMVLEAEEPPPGFGSYLKHWMNHSAMPSTRAVATEVVTWAGRVLPVSRR